MVSYSIGSQNKNGSNSFFGSKPFFATDYATVNGQPCSNVNNFNGNIKDNVVVLIRHRQHNLYFVVILLRYSILLYTVYNVFLGLHPSTSNKKTQLLPTIGVIHWTRRSFRRVVILLRYIIMLYHCTWRGRRYKRGKRRETTSR